MVTFFGSWTYKDCVNCIHIVPFSLVILLASNVQWISALAIFVSLYARFCQIGILVWVNTTCILWFHLSICAILSIYKISLNHGYLGTNGHVIPMSVHIWLNFICIPLLIHVCASSRFYCWYIYVKFVSHAILIDQFKYGQSCLDCDRTLKI